MKNKTSFTIRPIRPEDEPLMVKFHETMSEESVYYRYFTAMKLSQRVAHERLKRICFNDYDREIALVAESKSEKIGEQKILGVGRLSRIHGANEAEFAVLISDSSHGLGLGTELLKQLIKFGAAEKLTRITGQILAENHAMQVICKKIGFQVNYNAENHDYTAEYTF